MAVDPRILQAIADPTAGRLGDIGKTYATAKQRSIENQRADEKMKMLEDQQRFAQAKESYMAMGAYSKTIMNAVEEDPTLLDDKERMAELQTSTREAFPEGYKQAIPEGTQEYEEIQRGFQNASQLHEFFNPKTPKTTFELGGIQHKETGDIQFRVKSDPWLAEQVATGDWIGYTPSQAGTTADITKKTQSELSEQQMLAAEMQDDIAELETMWDDFGPGKMDWISQAGDASIRMMEKMGMPITEGMKTSSGQREKMKGRTKQLQTSWRLKVTGSQAGKWEIKDIASQPLNMDDTISQWEVKLPAWKDKADRVAVRTKLAKQQGFEHSGLVKMSDGREMPMWTNKDTGESRSIISFGALDKIPTMKDYMASELDKRYPDVDNMSDEEVRSAISEVRAQANSLGYR